MPLERGVFVSCVVAGPVCLCVWRGDEMMKSVILLQNKHEKDNQKNKPGVFWGVAVD